MATPQPSYPADSGFEGARGPLDSASAFAAQSFLIRQLIAGIATASLVKVLSVTNAGAVSAVGSVSVQPMVDQVSGNGQPTPHGQIFNLPYFRLQGGGDAVILDPKVNDIGVAIFCSRDISKVKVTKAPGPPGSLRQHDMADGLYMGGFLNGVPTQYVAFTAGGIILHSPTKVRVEAPIAEMTGELRVTGPVFAGYGTGDQVGLQTHVHAQPNDSHGDAESPTNPATPGT